MLGRARLLARPLRAAAFSARLLSAEQPQATVSKEALLKLRKSTGYSVYNCRKALLQFGNERLDEAGKWLREEARKEGWAKAAKLSSRNASQGLVGVVSKGCVGALVELHCETDFVANSAEFKALLEEITLAALEWGSNNLSARTLTGLNNIVPLSTGIETIVTREGRAVKEAVALAVGTLKENVVVARTEVVLTQPEIALQAYAHPKTGTEAVAMGKYASFLGIRRHSDTPKFPTARLSEQICQHIIGINPTSLGTPPDANTSAPATDAKTTTTQASTASNAEEEEHDELNEFATVESTHIDENEEELLKQSFMLNPQQTVHDYLTGHSAEVLWYSRTELGDNVKDVNPYPK